MHSHWLLGVININVHLSNTFDENIESIIYGTNKTNNYDRNISEQVTDLAYIIKNTRNRN